MQLVTSTMGLKTDLVEVRESPLHGKGVFAKKALPKGTIWWEFDTETTTVYTLDELEAFLENEKTSKEEILNVLWHGYLEEDNTWVVSHDGAGLTNHGFNSTASPEHPEASAVTRDIAEGEEILDDYTKYGRHEKLDELLKKHCPGRYEFEASLRSESK